MPVQECAFQISWDAVHLSMSVGLVWQPAEADAFESMWTEEGREVNPAVHSHCFDTVYTKP